jgi:NAD(P)-dependent dehydrogenase (short-subunit alcohol dehydrogenase family)
MNSLSRRFQNKVALITGGNSGIGRAIAIRLAIEGAAIGVLGRDLEKALQVRQEKVTAKKLFKHTIRRQK